MPSVDLLKYAYHVLARTACAKCFGVFCGAAFKIPVFEKYGEGRSHFYGMVVGKTHSCVSKLSKLFFRLYSSHLLSLYLIKLRNAKKLEINSAFLQVHDLLSVPAVLDQISDKFDALEECAKDACNFRNVHGEDYTKK